LRSCQTQVCTFEIGACIFSVSVMLATARRSSTNCIKITFQNPGNREALECIYVPCHVRRVWKQQEDKELCSKEHYGSHIKEHAASMTNMSVTSGAVINLKRLLARPGCTRKDTKMGWEEIVREAVDYIHLPRDEVQGRNGDNNKPPNSIKGTKLVDQSSSSNLYIFPLLLFTLPHLHHLCTLYVC
jgi:hypothetical protein